MDALSSGCLERGAQRAQQNILSPFLSPLGLGQPGHKVLKASCLTRGRCSATANQNSFAPWDQVKNQAVLCALLLGLRHANVRWLRTTASPGFCGAFKHPSDAEQCSSLSYVAVV